MVNKINNVIFFTGEATTGKTWISDQLARYLKSNNHVKTKVIHLGDIVRADQKVGIEPATSFIEKTGNKILLNKEEIRELMSYYLNQVDDSVECLLIEGFPRTRDDMDLLSEELMRNYYPEAKLSLVALSFKDGDGALHGMKERQKIQGKQREELSTEEDRQKKQENYINEIRPAIEYFKEKYKDDPNISLIDLKLESNEFFKNFSENNVSSRSLFQELLRKLPADLELSKYKKESNELSRQIKINFK